jgi:mannosyltransferase OCH1-like enzyme
MFKIQKYIIYYIALLILLIICIFFISKQSHHIDNFSNINSLENLNNNNDNLENINNNDNIIPRNIYQFWHSEKLPDKMLDYNNILKNNNTEFNIFIYNLNDCRIFIKDNFSEDILNAFDILIPIAYKSDLWRYCILYKYGGIYLDVKYYPVNNFKFINLIHDEHFCESTKKNNYGLHNGIIISKKNNPILLDAINNIVENVNNNFYGKNLFEITGSILLKNIFDQNKSYEKNILLNHYNKKNNKIFYNKKEILREYDEYEDEKAINGYLSNLSNLYNNKTIYYKINIPLNIYQTWYTKDLPIKMKDCVNILKKTNPEFNYYLYDDDDCRTFIKDNFSEEILDTFDRIIPGAYKADFWRYCILYINGGIYMDIKFLPINNFKFMNLVNKEYLCKDIKQSGSGIYNAIMICKPKNTLLLDAINLVVKNVKNNFYGYSPLEPTGPLLFKKILNDDYIEKLELSLNVVNSNIYISLNELPILNIYDEYRDEQKKNSNKPVYAVLWKNKNIYKTIDYL